MKSFKNHYNRSCFTSLLNNSSFENSSLTTNSLLYYNSFNKIQKDALVWNCGGNVVKTPGGFVLINGIFDFTFQLPFPSGNQCVVVQSTLFILQSVVLGNVQYLIYVCFKIRK